MPHEYQWRAGQLNNGEVSAAAARTAVTSEIAGSIWVILLLQVGFDHTVAALFAAVKHTPEYQAGCRASQETDAACCLVIALLFFVVDVAV